LDKLRPASTKRAVFLKNMNPEDILKITQKHAEKSLAASLLDGIATSKSIDYVCRCTSNRSGVRLIMACLLAKLDKPHVDPRKPYTEIGGDDCFSGRSYDEQYLTAFIHANRLPANATTAFLTPTLRNINQPLTTDRELVGRPRELYNNALKILEDVALQRIPADVVLTEIVRILINIRNEQDARMDSLLKSIKHGEGSLPLSSEDIVTLVKQHLACKHASRLPVLVVAAAYQAAGEKLAEQIRPLHGHNAADLQTGALGDLELCLVGENKTVTAYEMKMKQVTRDDIDHAVNKIARASCQVDNYLFVTTERIDPVVAEYAVSFYEKTSGTEVAIINCIDFIRHFLHLFHRIRTDYLNAYQELVLNEPDSSVSQALKEAFLALRKEAESD